MKQFPSIPRVANAPHGIFEGGHLWILEKVDGANFRFQAPRCRLPPRDCLRSPLAM